MSAAQDAVQDLLHRLQLRDVAVQQLKERCELMQEDYEHNFHLVQQQASELQGLRAKCSAQEKQVRHFEARCNVLSGKLREADGEVHRQTQSLHATVESLRAQLLVTQTEHGNMQRKYADLELQLATNRQEMQQHAGRMSRDADAVRREATMESESRLVEKERILRTREEQTLRDVQHIEHRCLELSSELSRVKELKETSDIRVEELTKTVARKEFMLQSAQEQINELRKTHAQQLHKLEVEAQGTVVLKEQYEKSTASQLLAMQREVERRSHENELLEQKMAAMRQQHEQDVRRRTEERDTTISGFEDKVRIAQDRLRAAEGRVAEVEDELDRQRRRVVEGKKHQSSLQVNGTLLEDRVDDLQRALANKDTEVARLRAELERVTAATERKEKEADELRAEFERRAWQDRVAEETDLEKKRLEWRRQGAMKVHNVPTAGADEHRPSTPPTLHGTSPVPWQPSYGAATPYATAAGALNLSALANDVKQQILLQQQSVQLGNNTNNNSSGSAQPHASTSSSSAPLAYLHELALLREQHQLEKVQLERRVQEANRNAKKYRNRVARLESQDEDDDDDGADFTTEEERMSLHSAADERGPLSSSAARRRVRVGGVTDTVGPTEHRYDGGAATTTPQRHLNDSAEVSMTSYPRDSVSAPGTASASRNSVPSTASPQQSTTTQLPRAPPAAAVSTRHPHQGKSSATTRVEQLQKHLAASPLAKRR